ncbi:hypothetical protein ANO11243_029390 [Dothideomycetidae sp. 11243]|nr:hypothetical protein ANO11243_029390 [fungal sp. No.11243]
MARYYRRSPDELDDDLAYGDMPPNRWDRDRFERARYEEQDRFEYAPRTTQVVLEERPRARYEERRYYEDISPPSPRRFTERVRREVFDERFRESDDDRALQPYRRDDHDRERERDLHIEIERTRQDAEPRPGLLRRQSSLTTFDRPRYARELEVIRRVSPPPRREVREEEIELVRQEEAPRQEYRDVEIIREREVTRPVRAKSVAQSVASDTRTVVSHHSHHTAASASSRTASSSSRSPSPPARIHLPGKKGFTKLPMGDFKKSAIERFGLPFTEEDNKYVIRRALTKEMIDQILQWSRESRAPRLTKYTFDGDRLTDGPVRNEHYESIRTEWVNPPSVRASSPDSATRSTARSSRRAPNPPSPPYPPAAETQGAPQPQAQPPPQQQQQQQPQPQPMPPQQQQPAYYVQGAQQPQFIPTPMSLQPLALAVPQRFEPTLQTMDQEIRRLNFEREMLRGERHHHHHPPGSQYYIPPPVYNYQQPFQPAVGGGTFIPRPYSPPSKEKEEKKKEKPKKPAKAMALMMSTLT